MPIPIMHCLYQCLIFNWNLFKLSNVQFNDLYGTHLVTFINNKNKNKNNNNNNNNNSNQTTYTTFFQVNVFLNTTNIKNNKTKKFFQKSANFYYLKTYIC